jgi:hypothetical protein
MIVDMVPDKNLKAKLKSFRETSTGNLLKILFGKALLHVDPSETKPESKLKSLEKRAPVCAVERNDERYVYGSSFKTNRFVLQILALDTTLPPDPKFKSPSNDNFLELAKTKKKPKKLKAGKETEHFGLDVSKIPEKATVICTDAGIVSAIDYFNFIFLLECACLFV